MAQVAEKDYFQEHFSPEVIEIFKTESEEPYLTINGATHRIVSLKTEWNL